MKKLAIIPAFNEEGKIGITVRRTVHYIDTVVVNDGSSDRTSDEAVKNGALVISHKINKGVGAAIRTGIQFAVKNGYDICVVLGGDNQDDPAFIDDLVRPIEVEGYDFVQGSRYIKNMGKKIPVFKSITTKLYTVLFRTICGYPVTDASNGFRAFRTSLYKKIDLKKCLNRYELEPYFMLKVIKNGYKFKEVPVSKKYYLKSGYTKMMPLVDWYRITKPLIVELLRL